MEMSTLDKISMSLLMIGGLNWGLIGFFDYNLVDEIFGAGSGISRFVYAVVGLAAVQAIYKMAMMMNAEGKKKS